MTDLTTITVLELQDEDILLSPLVFKLLDVIRFALPPSDLLFIHAYPILIVELLSGDLSCPAIFNLFYSPLENEHENDNHLKKIGLLYLKGLIDYEELLYFRKPLGEERFAVLDLLHLLDLKVHFKLTLHLLERDPSFALEDLLNLSYVQLETLCRCDSMDTFFSAYKTVLISTATYLTTPFTRKALSFSATALLMDHLPHTHQEITNIHRPFATIPFSKYALLCLKGLVRQDEITHLNIVSAIDSLMKLNIQTQKIKPLQRPADLSVDELLMLTYPQIYQLFYNDIDIQTAYVMIEQNRQRTAHYAAQLADIQLFFSPTLLVEYSPTQIQLLLLEKAKHTKEEQLYGSNLPFRQERISDYIGFKLISPGFRFVALLWYLDKITFIEANALKKIHAIKVHWLTLMIIYGKINSDDQALSQYDAYQDLPRLFRYALSHLTNQDIETILSNPALMLYTSPFDENVDRFHQLSYASFLQTTSFDHETSFLNNLHAQKKLFCEALSPRDLNAILNNNTVSSPIYVHDLQAALQTGDLSHATALTSIESHFSNTLEYAALPLHAAYSSTAASRAPYSIRKLIKSFGLSAQGEVQTLEQLQRAFYHLGFETRSESFGEDYTQFITLIQTAIHEKKLLLVTFLIHPLSGQPLIHPLHENLTSREHIAVIAGYSESTEELFLIQKGDLHIVSREDLFASTQLVSETSERVFYRRNRAYASNDPMQKYSLSKYIHTHEHDPAVVRQSAVPTGPSGFKSALLIVDPPKKQTVLNRRIAFFRELDSTVSIYGKIADVYENELHKSTFFCSEDTLTPTGPH